MFVYAGIFSSFPAPLANLIPYATMLGSSASLILIIVTMLIGGLSPPRWLELSVVGAPAISLLFAVSGLASPQQVVLVFNAPLNVLSLIASAAIVCRAAAIRGSRDARLLLVPLCLLGLAAMHDFCVMLGILDGQQFLSLHYRPVLMVGIGMILMRRLGTSLTQLDDANDRLRRSLAQREDELACLHEEDRRKAAVQIRHEERQRLTANLHDGLSGHLASIIALSEREKSSVIERTAREALDDLRLVIHSLDIDDRELGIALSGLRERLERQLLRLGIGLDWSTANLPEISSVTPTHALNVLRIVQEAVTNAITHGKARRIRISGSPTADGRARLRVENDGVPFSASLGGYGLHNMQRRVGQLGGEINIEPLFGGTRLDLLLPLQLPAIANPPAPMALPPLQWRTGKDYSPDS
jgi:signal transduction histidine kinase